MFVPINEVARKSRPQEEKNKELARIRSISNKLTQLKKEISDLEDRQSEKPSDKSIEAQLKLKNDALGKLIDNIKSDDSQKLKDIFLDSDGTLKSDSSIHEKEPKYIGSKDYMEDFARRMESLAKYLNDYNNCKESKHDNAYKYVQGKIYENESNKPFYYLKSIFNDGYNDGKIAKKLIVYTKNGGEYNRLFEIDYTKQLEDQFVNTSDSNKDNSVALRMEIRYFLTKFMIEHNKLSGKKDVDFTYLNNEKKISSTESRHRSTFEIQESYENAMINFLAVKNTKKITVGKDSDFDKIINALDPAICLWIYESQRELDINALLNDDASPKRDTLGNLPNSGKESYYRAELGNWSIKKLDEVSERIGKSRRIDDSEKDRLTQSINGLKASVDKVLGNLESLCKVTTNESNLAKIFGYLSNEHVKTLEENTGGKTKTKKFEILGIDDYNNDKESVKKALAKSLTGADEKTGHVPIFVSERGSEDIRDRHGDIVDTKAVFNDVASKSNEDLFDIIVDPLIDLYEKWGGILFDYVKDVVSSLFNSVKSKLGKTINGKIVSKLPLLRVTERPEQLESQEEDDEDKEDPNDAKREEYFESKKAAVKTIVIKCINDILSGHSKLFNHFEDVEDPQKLQVRVCQMVKRLWYSSDVQEEFYTRANDKEDNALNTQSKGVTNLSYNNTFHYLNDELILNQYREVMDEISNGKTKFDDCRASNGQVIQASVSPEVQSKVKTVNLIPKIVSFMYAGKDVNNIRFHNQFKRGGNQSESAVKIDANANYVKLSKAPENTDWFDLAGLKEGSVDPDVTVETVFKNILGKL